MKERSIAVFALLMLVLSGCTLVANGSDDSKAADSGRCGDNVGYQFDKPTGTLTISGIGPMYDYLSRGTECPYYEHHVNITKIIIGEGVTSIGRDAFHKYTGLTSVEISDSVKTVRARAFEGCTGLTSVSFGKSLETIEYDAFFECTGLAGILEIPDSVKTVGARAFQGCTGLTSVVIGKSVKTLPFDTFRECTKLSSVTFGKSVDSIGDSTFRGCTGLTSVEIPDTVKNISINAFENCTGLVSLTFGKSLETIGYDAFGNMKFFVNGPDGKSQVDCNADNLKGREFTGIYGKMYEKDKYKISYLLDGKPVSTMDAYSEKKNMHVIDISGYIKPGYTATGWTSYDVSIRGDGTFDMGEGNVIIFATSVPNHTPDNSSAKDSGNKGPLMLNAAIGVLAILAVAVVWHTGKQA